jgi:tubulin polyglutamylase TTLL1
MVYSYKRALIKRCAGAFNVTSEDIPSHICNTAIVEKNKGKEDEGTDQSENSEESNEEYFIDWDLDGIEKLLVE